MMTLFAAAALAAQPVSAPPAPAPEHPMMQMGGHMSGQMGSQMGANHDECSCCKDMEAKMKESHHGERGDHASE
jgi:hypothetical protein